MISEYLAMAAYRLELGIDASEQEALELQWAHDWAGLSWHDSMALMGLLKGEL